MNRSITNYYKKMEKDRSNNNDISHNNNCQNNCHKSNSDHKSYKLQNTSRNSQRQQPYNIQNRWKFSASVSNIESTDKTCDTISPFAATSSKLLPSKTSSSLEYMRQPQKSPPSSTLTASETAVLTTKSAAVFNVETAGASSTSPSSSSVDSVLLRGWSSMPTTSTDTSHLLTKINSRNATRKRKRQDSINEVQVDPDLGSEPPSAKRKQALPSPYKSDASSMASSMYPSPVDMFVHEIDTHSSCDYLPAEADFDATADCIPDSPNSLRQDDDDVEEEDDEVVSATTSPSICSVDSSKGTHHIYEMHTINQVVERTPGQITQMANKIVANPSNVTVIQTLDDYTGTQFNCMTPGAEPEELRQCPLPSLSWANADDVWQLMCKKDQQAACLRSGSMLERHPSLQPRMRAILLDWLIEVCEVYKLQRETYYLAVDYLDRYLSVQKNIQKTHLQLIGITCLFVAAKVEEIYPPKIGEFAYVTDGACQESDILQHEVLLLQTLEWSINPVTPMGWLGVYMQLNVNNRTPASFKRITCKTKSAASTEGEEDTNDAFIYPQFSGMEFVQTAQLLDLCSLDLGIAEYSYSIIAAAAMSHTFNREIALRCSGLDWEAIDPCARWMQPFFQVVREESTYLALMEQNDQVTNRFGLAHICPNIITDDSHIIQTHTISMGMFDRIAQLQQHSLANKICTEASPATGLLCPEGLLTPPASSRKPVDATDVDEDHDPNSVERLKNMATVTGTNPVGKPKSSANEVKIGAKKPALT
ncbi:G1/S-specific cyclin-E isoform X1 [Anastrepha ludens]|uniref:G1/S-specific cyclin-E isoform X1 n=2 Tax=Anastrepha ludens TaxID=28586 RepID=UPI0023AF8ABE|nr:G1/S-specific cyclin-E isoform X1 [Anastrepha ludens]